MGAAAKAPAPLRAGRAPLAARPCSTSPSSSSSSTCRSKAAAAAGGEGGSEGIGGEGGAESDVVVVVVVVEEEEERKEDEEAAGTRRRRRRRRRKRLTGVALDRGGPPGWRARGQVGVEDVAGLHAVRHGDVVVAVVVHADLIARQHAGGARDRDGLDRVGVAQRAAAALMRLPVKEPAVDALAVIGVSTRGERADHLAREQQLHAQGAVLGVAATAVGSAAAAAGLVGRVWCFGQGAQRRAHAQLHLLAMRLHHEAACLEGGWRERVERERVERRVE